VHVTFRQLRLFKALAEHGSVSRAARACHVTQPTASMQLREITEAVGVPLYEVIAKRVHLTEAGRQLAETARAIEETWRNYEQSIDALRGLRRGTLRLAVVSTAKYFVPRLLGAFCKRYPEVDFSLVVGNRDSVVERLRQNLDDFYVMSMPPNDLDLECHDFEPNPLVVIAPERHPLARQSRIPLAGLSGESYVLREPGSGTRMAVDAHFRRERFRPRIRMELGSNEALKEAVAGGLGLSVISSHALHGRSREYGVTVLDVEGFPLPSAWHVVWPRGKRLSPLAQVFLDEHLLAGRGGTAPFTKRRTVKRGEGRTGR
jgi:DNA-binding transcriptional LysR family regulator